jgi:uncharacterized coiled-coil protein SlyX
MATYTPQQVVRIIGVSAALLRNVVTRFAMLLTPNAVKAPMLSDGRYGPREYTPDDLVVLKKIGRLLQGGRTYEEVELELGLRKPEPSTQEVVAAALSSAAAALDPSQAPAAQPVMSLSAPAVPTPTLAPRKPLSQLALLQQTLAEYQARLEKLEVTAAEPPTPVVSAEEWAELLQAVTQQQTQLEQLETASKNASSAADVSNALHAITQQQIQLEQLQSTLKTAASNTEVSQALQLLAQQQERLRRIEAHASVTATAADVTSVKQVVAQQYVRLQQIEVELTQKASADEPVVAQLTPVLESIAEQQSRLERLESALTTQPAVMTELLTQLTPLLQTIADQQTRMEKMEERLTETEDRLAAAYTLMANHLFLSQSRRSGRWSRYLIWRESNMVYQFYLGPATEQEVKQLQAQATQIEIDVEPTA